MEILIIYPSPDGGIHMVVPAGSHPVEEVAKKDVPRGLPYLFVEKTNIPEDIRFFSAWEADFSNPDGYGMGDQSWLINGEPND
jgi:hypothetical protein